MKRVALSKSSKKNRPRLPPTLFFLVLLLLPRLMQLLLIFLNLQDIEEIGESDPDCHLLGFEHILELKPQNKAIDRRHHRMFRPKIGATKVSCSIGEEKQH